MSNNKKSSVGKVLICVPKLSLPGGVAQYNRTIREFMPGNVRFFERSYSKTLPGKLLAAIGDLVRYTILLLVGNIQKVCLNPSLGSTAVKRDGVYAFIAKKIFRKKLVIFWHGWDPEYAEQLPQKQFQWFCSRYFAADKMLVLHSQAKNTLKSWGYSQAISIVSTCFEKCFDNLPEVERQAPPYKVLFLARAEKAKGIMLALDIAERLTQQSDISVEIMIAGDGSALADAKKFAADHQLDQVTFCGFVTGQQKIELLSSSHIFLQCSYHEGLPCSLLEAMACGFAVVTSAVGGIVDFFEEEKMGFMVKTMNPEDFAEKIIELLRDPEKLENIGKYNRNYARKHFTARQAAARQNDEIQKI